MPRFLFTIEQMHLDALRRLSEQTKVSMSEYVRQGVEMLLQNTPLTSGSFQQDHTNRR